MRSAVMMLRGPTEENDSKTSMCGGSRILSSDQSALAPLISGHLHFAHFDLQLMSAQNDGASSSDVYSIVVILMNTCHTLPNVTVLCPSFCVHPIQSPNKLARVLQAGEPRCAKANYPASSVADEHPTHGANTHHAAGQHQPRGPARGQHQHLAARGQHAASTRPAPCTIHACNKQQTKKNNENQANKHRSNKNSSNNESSNNKSNNKISSNKSNSNKNKNTNG